MYVLWSNSKKICFLEYGATAAFFPPDDASMAYLQQTNRNLDTIEAIDTYLKASKLKRNYNDQSQDPVFSTVVGLDLTTVVPSCSGPKRPHDRVAVKEMKSDFTACLNNPVGFKGYAIPNDKLNTTVPFILDGQEHTLRHGSVLIAAITSCTNTSNPRLVFIKYVKEIFFFTFLIVFMFCLFVFWREASFTRSLYRLICQFSF